MKIGQFEVVDRCLFWKEKKILVVGDLHLGWEEHFMEQGWSFPRTQIEETLGLLRKVLQKTGKLKKIILLGDVKHYFAGVLKSEFEDFFNVVEVLKKSLLKNGKVIVTKGNHDNILEPVVRNYDFVKLVDFYVEDGVIFFHGDRFSFKKVGLKFYNKKIKVIVNGHFHPAVFISEKKGVKRELYKCFLVGRAKELKKEMILMPSFFPLVDGTDLGARDLNLEGRIDVKNFEVYVLTGGFGGVLGFGRVGGLV